METTYRLNAQEIGLELLHSIRTLFADQEVEISVKTAPTSEQQQAWRREALLDLVTKSRQEAPRIEASINLRELIDATHDPDVP